MSSIILIFDIILIACFALSILSGFRNGLIRTSIKKGVKPVLLILLLIFSRTITKAILNIEISIDGTSVSLLGYITSMIIESAGNNEGIADILSDLVISVARIPVFIAGIFVINLILEPIIKLILRICLPFMHKKNRKEIKMKSRVLGAVVAAGCSLIIFIITILPIYGILEVANVALTNIDIQSETEKLSNSDDDEILEMFDNSIILKMTSNIGKKKDGLFGVGAKMLGAEFRIKTQFGKINFVKEADGLYRVSSRIMEFADDDITPNEIIKQMTDEDIDLLIDYLKDSDIFEMGYNLTVELIDEILAESETPIEIDTDAIKHVKLDDDLQAIGNFLKTTLKVAKHIDLEQEISEQIVNNKEVLNLVDDLVKDAFSIQLFDICISGLLIDTINDALIEMDLKNFVGIVDKAYLKQDLAIDIEKLLDAYLKLDEIGFIDSLNTENAENAFDYNDAEKVTKLKNSLLKILELKLIDGHQTELFTYALEITGLTDTIMLTEDDFKNIDYSVENKNIVELLIAVLRVGNVGGSFNENLIHDPAFKDNAILVGDLFDKLYECNITKAHVFDYLDMVMQLLDTEYDITLTTAEKQAIINNTAKYELEILADVIIRGSEYYYSESIAIEELNGSDITNLMLDASEGVLASKIVGTILNNMLGSDGLGVNPVLPDGTYLYDYRNPDVLSSQAVSVGTYIDLHNAMNNFKENEDAMEIENITTLIKDFATEGNNNEIIEDILETISSKDVVVDSSVDWNETANIVEDVLNMYDTSVDKDNFDISNDPELAEKVENSDVAYAILEYLGLV